MSFLRMNCLQLGGNTPISELGTQTSVEQLQSTFQRKFPSQIAIVNLLEKIQSGHSHPGNHCVGFSNSNEFFGSVAANNGVHYLFLLLSFNSGPRLFGWS